MYLGTRGELGGHILRQTAVVVRRFRRFGETWERAQLVRLSDKAVPEAGNSGACLEACCHL